MTALVRQQLTNNQDVLASTAKALGVEGSADISTNISTRINQLIDQTFVNQMFDNVISVQTMTLTSSTSGTFVSTSANPKSAAANV